MLFGCHYTGLFVFSSSRAVAQKTGVTSQTAASIDEDIWDIARGGQLYDNWMAVLDAEPPEGTHPAYPKFGKKKGQATWRCKECHGWGVLFSAGIVAGIILWGGFNTFMAYTNILEFCVSCHEMEQKVYQEYKKSSHFLNPSGVRVTCPDCHVPKNWVDKLLRKIEASKEIYHKLIGTIDTPEKFEEKRLEMAESVWASMEATDSRECRNCHSYGAMNFDDQSRRAKEKMSKARDEGKTCIDCHKGLAHKLPDDYESDD